MSGYNAAEILRLMRTSKAFEVMARDFLRRAYNVNKPLRRFFQDPIAFRVMQYETGTVVSGSFALQFFVRSYYLTADLDLYVTHSGAEKVGSWLQENGYTYVPAKKKTAGKGHEAAPLVQRRHLFFGLSLGPRRVLLQGCNGSSQLRRCGRR